MKKKLLIALTGLFLALPATAQVSVEQEVQLGRQAAQKIEAESGLDNNPELNQRLQRIAQILVPVCGRNDIQYSFKVLNSEEFNAMALPGGFVYATRKLMRTLPDGPLCFVLGHELAHVVQRHSIRQMENDQMRRMGLMAVLIGLGGGSVDRNSAQLAGVVDQVMSSRYSQADEAEADQLGTAMLARAGVDPAWALLALHTLAEMHNDSTPSFVNAIVGSHPLPQERIQAAYQYIPPLAYSPGPRRNGSSPPPPTASGSDDNLERLLERGLVQSTALRSDADLKDQARRDAQQSQFGSSGLFLVSPPSEPFSSLERRLYAQELAWRMQLQPQPQAFGLTVRATPAGDRLVWVRLR